jgi:hypothetical protein
MVVDASRISQLEIVLYRSTYDWWTLVSSQARRCFCILVLGLHPHKPCAMKSPLAPKPAKNRLPCSIYFIAFDCAAPASIAACCVIHLRLTDDSWTCSLFPLHTTELERYQQQFSGFKYQQHLKRMPQLRREATQLAPTTYPSRTVTRRSTTCAHNSPIHAIASAAWHHPAPTSWRLVAAPGPSAHCPTRSCGTWLVITVGLKSLVKLAAQW